VGAFADYFSSAVREEQLGKDRSMAAVERDLQHRLAQHFFVVNFPFLPLRRRAIS
jgi:hypothetical protein